MRICTEWNETEERVYQVKLMVDTRLTHFKVIMVPLFYTHLYHSS
jgi:hypothetical protein